MSIVVAVLIMLLLAGVLVVITGPLRRAEREASPERDTSPQDDASVEPAREESLADLEAAREAKYREIRDAELDFRTGKLAEADYRAIDAELRREALEILDRLERAGGPAPEGL